MDTQKVTMICQDQTKNQDKYYIMKYKKGASQFEVEYGRIGKTMSKYQYNVGEWSSLLKSKLKKGYIDISTLPVGVGSAVVTPLSDLCLVVKISFLSNVPHELRVQNEQGKQFLYKFSEVSPGYLKPGSLTHEMFYQNLIKLQKKLTNII